MEFLTCYIEMKRLTITRSHRAIADDSIFSKSIKKLIDHFLFITCDKDLEILHIILRDVSIYARNDSFIGDKRSFECFISAPVMYANDVMPTKSISDELIDFFWDLWSDVKVFFNEIVILLSTELEFRKK